MATILVTDDRPTARQFLVTLLGYVGHRVLEAEDGAELLRVARVEHPDLVITDLVMPVMDGFEAVLKMREDPALRDTPVLFYTATYREREAEMMARRLGVLKTLTKPSEPQAILDAVRWALGLADAAQAPSVPEQFYRGIAPAAAADPDRHLRELGSETLRLAALVELGLDLIEEQEPFRILQSTCQAARRILGTKYAAIGILEAPEQPLRHLFLSGMTAVPHPPGPPSGAPAEALRTGRALRLDDVPAGSEGVPFPPRLAPRRPLLVVPLLTPRGLLGFLCAADTLSGQPFSGQDQQLAETLAAQAALAYEASTQRLELERALEEKSAAERERTLMEARFHELCERSPVAVFRTTQDGRILYANPAGVEMLGYASTADLMLVRSPSLYASPGERDEILALLRERGILKNRELVLLRRDGTPVPVLANYSLVQGVPQQDGTDAPILEAVFVDITERKRAEEARAELEERFRELAENVEDVFWVSTIDGSRMDYVSPAYEKIFGRSTELLYRNPLDWMVPVDPLDRERIQASAEAQGSGFDEEYRIVLPDGRVRWIHARAAPIRDAREGRVLRVAGIAQDITESKEAEAARQASEARYRALFDVSPEPIWVYEQATQRFLEVNAAAIAKYGYSREEFLAMTIQDIRLPEDRPRLSGALQSTAARARGVSRDWRHRKKDGSLIWVDIAFDSIQYDGREARLVLAHDVTERKLLEDQLRQAQKMEAVGRLAGGIAHDFNNLLTTIMGYADLLQMRQGALEGLDEIAKAAERASGLTRQLLAFSRKQVLDPRVIDLNEIVRGMEKMLQRLIGEDVRLVTSLVPSVPGVLADPGQIEQVIMNLAVNARDAMPEGGVLTIATSEEELSEQDAARQVGLVPGRLVLLNVTDSGTGIDAETQAQIFEPFFTTKEAGKGTGLGLSTVYGIVKQSGGSISVSSKPGEGASFLIRLPRAARPVDEVERKSSHPRLAVGSETVLVVEDEAALRDLARAVLEGAGYTVLSAESGERALELLEGRSTRVDLLLTDVVMGGMGGRKLAEALAPRYPRLKVLYMSGYTDDTALRHGIVDQGTHFLQKPFTPSKLLEKLRDLLG